MAIDEIVWLIVELANQHILVNNFKTGSTETLLTAETVELLTTPFDLAGFKDSIMEALNEGPERSVHSKPAKNTKAEQQLTMSCLLGSCTFSAFICG